MSRPGALALAVALLALLAPPGPARSARPLETHAHTANTAEWLYGGDESFMAVTILGPERPRRRGEVFRVRVLVRESLRGETPRDLALIDWPDPPQAERQEFVDDGPWLDSLYADPVAGARMILGGTMRANGSWESDAYLRFSDADGRAGARRAAIAEWTPRVLVRRRLAAQTREAARRKASADSARAVADHIADEAGWIDRERALRDAADIDLLVRLSDVVLMADPPESRSSPLERGSAIRARVRQRLFGAFAPTAAGADTFATLLFTADVDSVRRRWHAAPADDAPGAGVGQPFTCLLFLRNTESGNAVGEPGPYLLPVDPIASILWADAATVAAVRAAVARRGDMPSEPALSCGAGIEAFRARDSTAAATVTIRVQRTDTQTRLGRGYASLLLASAPDPRQDTPYGTRYFPPRFDARAFPATAFAARLYGNGRGGAYDNWGVRARFLAALLDSLCTLPDLVAGRIDPADSLTLTLRRIDATGEHVFEATLDDSARFVVCRMIVAALRDPGMPGQGFGAFWGPLDPRLAPIWWPAPPPRPRVVEPGTELARPHRGRGAVVGFAADAVTGDLLGGATIVPAFKRQELGPDGASAAADGASGPTFAWYEASCPGYRTGYALARLRPGEFTPLAVDLVPLHRSPGPIRRRAVAPFAMLPPSGARVVVLVHDPAGASVPRAWVLVRAPGETHGGFTDARGEIAFPFVPPGRASVVVRASGARPFAAAPAFLAATTDTLVARLEPYFTRR